MGLYVKAMEGQRYRFGVGRKSYVLFYKCIFRRDFLSPACCNSLGYWKLSQHLHVLLLWWSGIDVTALRLLKSAVQEYISPRTNCRLYIVTLSWVTVNFVGDQKHLCNQSLGVMGIQHEGAYSWESCCIIMYHRHKALALWQCTLSENARMQLHTRLLSYK